MTAPIVPASSLPAITPGSRTLIVMNPAAGQSDTERVLRLLAGAFAVRGASFDVAHTAAAGDAQRMAHEAAAHGYRAVVAVGGDGTVGEVITGVAGTDVPVGIIPKGTANQVAGQPGHPPRRGGGRGGGGERAAGAHRPGAAGGRALLRAGGGGGVGRGGDEGRHA